MADPVTAIAAAKAAYETAKFAGKRAQDVLCTDTMKQGIVMALFSQRDRLQKMKVLLCSPESNSNAIFDNIVASLTAAKGFPGPIRKLIQNNPNFFKGAIESFKRSQRCTPGSLETPEQFKVALNNLVGLMCSRNTNELKQKYNSLRTSMKSTSMAPAPVMNMSAPKVNSMNTSMATPSINMSPPKVNSMATAAPTAGGRRKSRRHTRKTRKTRKHRRV
jgi:hypothetical protein